MDSLGGCPQALLHLQLTQSGVRGSYVSFRLQLMSRLAFQPCSSTHTWWVLSLGLFGSQAASYEPSSLAALPGVSPPPGAVLALHSLPLEFPLAMAFAEQLLSWRSEDGEGRAEDEPDTIPTSVLLQVVELLGEAYLPSGLGLGELGGLAQGLRKALARWWPLIGLLSSEKGLWS